MLDQVAAAFDQQDYRTVARLLKQWQQQAPQDPWFRLYVGRYQEVSGQREAAEKIYRLLLREGVNSKIAAQARQGLQRLAGVKPGPLEPQLKSRSQSTASSPPVANSLDWGFLALEAVTGERRPVAAAALAQVMQVDLYTARTVIPNRGWRLYRAGAIADIQRTGLALQQAGIAAVWVAIADVQQMKVFQVSHFQTLGSQPTVVCVNEAGQLGAIAFDWAEVSQRVEGRLPIFEQVVVLGYRDRPERQEAIQDYAQFCDLHLPQRGCILRLSDQQYDFHQGVELGLDDAMGDRAPMPNRLATMRLHWNQLLSDLGHHLSHAPAWSDFSSFADSTPDFEDALSRILPQISLSRAESTYWDAAFHLYSGLVFWRTSKTV